MQPIVMPAVSAFSTLSIRASGSTWFVCLHTPGQSPDARRAYRVAAAGSIPEWARADAPPEDRRWNAARCVRRLSLLEWIIPETEQEHVFVGTEADLRAGRRACAGEGIAFCI